MHSRAFTAGWLVGAVLLSSWAVSSASDERGPARAQAAGMPAAAALPRASADLDAEISRIAAWTHALAAAPSEPKRNLFEFEVRSSKFEVQRTKFEVRGSKFEVPAAASTSNLPGGTLNSPASTLNLPASTSNFELRTPNLTAIADAGGMTAVISFGDALHYVKKGDVIAERFRVDVVGTQGVELFDLTLGTILRLSLYVAS